MTDDIINYGNENGEQTVKVQIESSTETAKSELWDNMKREIEAKYVENGIPFNPDTINSRESMEQAVEILKGIQESKRQAAENRGQSPAPTRGGETAMLQSQYRLDNDSDTDLGWIKASSEEELIAIAQSRAKKGDRESQEFLKEISKRVVKNGRLDIEFSGNIRDFSRSLLPTSEFMNSEEKERRDRINSYLKKNRVNWQPTQRSEY